MDKLLIPSYAAMLLLAISTGANAQVYKCTDERGRPQFSDRPCAENAEQVDVTVQSSGISHAPQGDFSQVSADIKRRELERRVERIEDEIDALEKDLDRKLQMLQVKQSYAANNLAGATFGQSIATEMAATSQDYSARIQRKQDEITRLHQEISELKSSAP